MATGDKFLQNNNLAIDFALHGKISAAYVRNDSLFEFMSGELSAYRKPYERPKLHRVHERMAGPTTEPWRSGRQPPVDGGHPLFFKVAVCHGKVATAEKAP